MNCETWPDRESLDAHSKTVHFARLVGKSEAFCGTLKRKEFLF